MKVLVNCILIGLVYVSGPLFAEQSQPLNPQVLVDKVAAGGHIIYFRHAPTVPKSKDNNQKKANKPLSVDYFDCSTQRNLSAHGREVAKALRKALARNAIPVDKVYASPYCRTRETAQTIFDDVELDENLAFSLSRSPEDSARLGRYLKEKMQNLKLGQGNTVLVGHSSNIRDGLGVWPKPEGTAAVFSRDGQALNFLGMIKPDDWPE
ncbi:MAG: histidine phosphatase family protein [Pseudomonadales bacterium]